MGSRAAVKMGGILSLDGEKEYKKAIKDITSELKVNYAQMGLVAAQYDAVGDTQGKLRASTEMLTKNIDIQKDKIEVLKKRLEEASNGGKENNTVTDQHRIALAKAETELVKMNNQMEGYQQQLAQVNEETQNASKHTKSLSDVALGMADTFGLSVPPAMQSTISKLDGVSASGAAAVGIIGAIVTGLGKLTISTSKTADNLLTLSSTTGMSTDALQEFEYASELLDVSSNTLQGSLTKLIKNMSTARDGTGEAAEAFKTLHIKVANSNGSLKDANEVFYKAIDALGKVKNETDRDAMSMQIFGKSARELNPLIEAGSARLKELGVEAHNVGYVMDNETLQQFGQLDDAMQRMSKQGDALKNSFAIALLPMMTAVAEAVSKIPTPLLRIVIVLGGLVTVGVLIAKTMRDVAVANAILSASNVVLGTTSTVAGAGLSSMIPGLLIIGAILAIVAGGIALFNNQIDSVTKKADSLAKTQIPQLPNNYPRYATGTNFHPGGRAIVGENGPEVIDLPRGSRVYPNGKYPNGGGDYVDQRQYIFKVDNIETYMAIERRLKNEQKSIRQGVI